MLLTAMPPTKGHLRLVQFSAALAPTTVILATQPHEPFVLQRYAALQKAMPRGATVQLFNKTMPQDPETPGFRAMWRNIFREFGFCPGDYFVGSEMYGVWLAEELEGTFIPYDIDREILYTKGTRVRQHPLNFFEDILPEFQKYLIKTVTVFGAESCGKTTLSKELAQYFESHWLPEWARPYMEKVDGEMSHPLMDNIWHAQGALQEHARNFRDKPLVVQDTDLLSTVGYWEIWDKDTLPLGLTRDAKRLKSDLYLICQSNIPFEPDPLRFGGDKRESPDSFWIDLADRYGVNYVIIDGESRGERKTQAINAILNLWEEKVVKALDYKREFND